MKVKLYIDSTCDMPSDYLKENDVSLIPLYVTFNEEQYLDFEEITTPLLYQKIEEKKMLPKTAARSIEDFKNAFSKALDNGYDNVVFLSISSQFSSGYQNACIAAEEFDGKVFIHDTMNLSSGEGLQLIHAIRMAKEGLSGKEICEQLKDIALRVRSQFAVESLEYLYKGGRCSQTAYFLGQGFKIKPIIRVVDGKMIVYKKPIGKITNALNKLIDIFNEDLKANNVELGTVMITHSIADNSCEYLFNELKKLIPEENIMITKAGCVISSHCGKGTIGILYILKK